ncbi:SAM-dependent methyltransferase [Mycolicibacterium litorale]|uniref:SAM-dependent methyltransferase n=1 Tax=Mycolicibacterium litorale TaxID=758802 RepID=A0A6S6PBH2_9MYCO|nr:class I SAM-dependent methyltransferase [Mycolicibacterium litorale]BCI56094.1 SAM-dependent methyltransferase [Mycolicibacterium litorale]
MTEWASGDYDAVARRIAGIARHVVDAVAERRPLAGAAVVDLACGTGTAALAAAAHGARVTGVDVTPELIAVAAENACRSGLNLTWEVADATETGLPSGSAEAVVSSMGLIFTEPDAQVKELARLLKPGGVVGFSAWLRVAVNPLIDPIGLVLGPPPGATFSPDGWAETATTLARLWPAFTDIRITTATHRWVFASLPDALSFVVDTSPMHISAIERAGRRRDRLIGAFETALAAHVGADGRVAFDAPYRVITAERRTV